MAAETPFWSEGRNLGPLDSWYVDVEALPWKDTPTKGISMKILLQDKETGLMTALFRWEPGTELPLHEHVEIEQTYVLSGSIVDDDGVAKAGNYVWRPQGHQHVARSPDGALVLAFFLRPNKFLSGDLKGQLLE